MSGKRVITTHIVVLGGGPAGGATALGLARQGYSVALATQPRPFEALEGISERVLAGLRSAGFDRALHAIADPTPRRALWNGASTQVNTERLVDRAILDRGVTQDLQSSGVKILQGRIRQVSKSEHGYRIDVTDGADSWRLNAEVLVEARGRRAPSLGSTRLRGPATVSLLQCWQGPPLSAQSAVESFVSGWAWMAVGAEGRRYFQLTMDAESQALPPRQQIEQFCWERLAQLESAQPFLPGARPVGPMIARASTPLLNHPGVGEDWIRVGDAAMAVDPLSGNGIFQALSSALLAPAVINTLIHKPAQGELARAFYRQRLEQLFLRFARLGRDFYRMEERWSGQKFWSARTAWPDDSPVHENPDHTPLRIEQRPVVCEGYIESRPVVITADQPLGVWQVAGIAIAPLLDKLRREPLSEQDSIEVQLRRRSPMSPSQAHHIIGWLRQHGLV